MIYCVQLNSSNAEKQLIEIVTNSILNEKHFFFVTCMGASYTVLVHI